MSKSIVLSLLSVFAITAMVGGVALAAFTSTASNNGNTFGSGTLTLKINGAGGSDSTKVFNLADKAPGFTQTQVLDLSNTGTIAASKVLLSGIAINPSGPGNLGEVLTLDLVKDVNGNGTYDPGTDTVIKTAHLNDSWWTNTDLGFGLDSSASQKVLAILTFDEGASNSYQGKTLTFDMTFKAEQ